MRNPAEQPEGYLQSGSIPVIPWKADRDKKLNAAVVTPLCEAGLVHLPADAPWLEELFQELCNFPNARHDDIVDSVTHALGYMRNTGGLHGYMLQVLERRRQEAYAEARGEPPQPVSNPLVDAYKRRLGEFEGQR